MASTLRTQATAAGLTAPQMGGDGMNDPSYITGAGSAADGSYASGSASRSRRSPAPRSSSPSTRPRGSPTQPRDYGPHAYDAANAIIATLKTALKGKSSLPTDTRAKVIAGLQATKLTGVTGPIQFDKYGDIVAATFTLYKVDGSPPAWTAVAKSGTTTTK